MNLPEIKTARLRLRPFTLNDVDDIHRLWIDPDVRKYLWDDEVISRERAASAIDASIAHFESDGLGLWAVFPHGENRLIGFCGFWFFHDPPQLQLLYGIAPSHWGKGFATEVAKAMIRYGFEKHSFDRIEASADVPNLASLRVMEKAGMHFQKRVCASGLDTVYYVISRGELRADAAPYLLRRAYVKEGF